MADLDDYLKGEVGEGQLDSHGTFTLSLTEALKKFGAYGSKIPCGFILKLVQAACLLRAERMVIDEYPSKLVIHVEVSPAKLDFKGLLGNFEKHLLGSSDWQSYMCRALLSASAELNRPGYLAIWQNKRFSPSLVFPRAAQEAHFNLTLDSKLGAGFTWQMETPPGWKLNLDELMGRLGFCPFPVNLNQRVLRFGDYASDLRVKGWRVQCSLGVYSSKLAGQLIADLYSWEDVEEPYSMLLRPACSQHGIELSTVARVGRSFALDWLRGQSPKMVEVPFRGLLKEPAATPPTVRIQARYGGGKSMRTLEQTTTAGSLQAAFLSAYGDRLIPVVWGVALEPIQKCWKCAGLEVVASLPDLPTDLTGERLIEGPELQKWLSEKRPLLADWLDQPLACLEEMTVGRIPSHAPTVIGVALGAMSAVLLGLPFIAAHTGMVGGLLGAGVRALQRKKYEALPNPELRDYFQASLCDLQRQLRSGTAPA